MISIDKQHSKPAHRRVGKEDYLHILQDEGRTFKVSIHLDYSYPVQSRVHIYHWHNGQWNDIHYIFGESAEKRFGDDVNKIEKHLLTVAKKITGKGFDNHRKAVSLA